MVATDLKTKIPEGWQIKNVANLCNKISMGETLIADKLTGDGVPVFSANTENRPWGYTSNNRLTYSKGTIIVGARGSIGFPRLPEFENYTSTQTTIALFPKINSKYLYYLLSKLNFSDIADQQAVPMLTVESTNNIFFTIPQNPKEQQKIAEVLTTVVEAIEKTDAIIEKNMRIKQGLMQDLFRYGIDEHGNIRSEKTHKFKTVKSGNEEMRIPEEWEIKKIQGTTYLKGRIGWQGLRFEEFIEKGPNLVTGTDILNGKISWDYTYHVSYARFKISPQIHLKNGDLLITKDGTIGKTALVDNCPKYAVLNSGLFLMRPLGNAYTNEYMYYLLNSFLFSKFLRDTETGSTIKHLFQGVFEKFKFFVPKIPEQSRICRILKNTDLLIEKESQYKAKLILLKNGLMEDLLTGTVRVSNLMN